MPRRRPAGKRALLELDATAASAAIAARRQAGERVSLFAFLVHAIAATLAEHPALNSVRAGGLLGHRIYTFEDVDVSVPVEVDSPEGPAPLELVLRRAHTKAPAALYAEIEAARERFRREGELGREDRVSRRYMWLAGFVPPFVRRFLDHGLVDGGPAARFVRRLQERIERAEGLSA